MGNKEFTWSVLSEGEGGARLSTGVTPKLSYNHSQLIHHYTLTVPCIQCRSDCTVTIVTRSAIVPHSLPSSLPTGRDVRWYITCLWYKLTTGGCLELESELACDCIEVPWSLGTFNFSLGARLHLGSLGHVIVLGAVDNTMFKIAKDAFMEYHSSLLKVYLIMATLLQEVAVRGPQEKNLWAHKTKSPNSYFLDNVSLEVCWVVC